VGKPGILHSGQTAEVLNSTYWKWRRANFSHSEFRVWLFHQIVVSVLSVMSIAGLLSAIGIYHH